MVNVKSSFRCIFVILLVQFVYLSFVFNQPGKTNLRCAIPETKSASFTFWDLPEFVIVLLS